jgi:hypothetical protein
MVGTWVPGPPGLSCTYMYKDAPFEVWVSRGVMGGWGEESWKLGRFEGWTLKEDRGPPPLVFCKNMIRLELRGGGMRKM